MLTEHVLTGDDRIRRWTFKKAKQVLGLDMGFEVRTEENYEFALNVCKEKIVDARKCNDDALAAHYSQVKEVLKKRYRNRTMRFCSCGTAKTLHSDRCQVCNLTYRYYHNQVTEMKEQEHQIEHTVLIPQRMLSTGVLPAIVKELAETGQIGDSFVTSKTPNSVKACAARYAVQIMTRTANPEEKDKKKRRIRVWRTDGKTPDEINEIIQKRINKNGSGNGTTATTAPALAGPSAAKPPLRNAG